MSGEIFVDPDEKLFGISLDNATHASMLSQYTQFRYKEESEGETVLVFDHDTPMMGRVAALGYDVTGHTPFSHYYEPNLVEGLYRPMAHQLVTAEFMTVHRRGYVLSTMRTGKTGSAVMALDYLSRHNVDRGKTLVVCPVSVMEGVWERTLKSMIPDADVAMVRGSRDKRLRIMERGPDYMIINYDGLQVVEDELSPLFARLDITKVVIDELSNYGNPQAARYRKAHALFNGANGAKRLWGMTGSPGANTIAVFGYSKMVNYAKMPCKSVHAWRGLTQYKYGNEAWMWRDTPEAAGLITKALQPSIRFTKEEVLKDLPPVTRSQSVCELTRDQLRAYHAMKEELIVAFENGQAAEANQKSALLSKLFQICLGGVITSDGGTYILDNKPRIDMLEELIRETERKTVVFCNYVACIDDLVAKLGGRGLSAVKVDGSVTGAKRDQIFRGFQNEPEPRVLIAHPLTTAYGTELAAADQLIFNGPMMSGTHIYMQAEERISSNKQTSDRIHIVELSASAEERQFFSSLHGKKRLADAVGTLFKSIVDRRT